MIDDKLNQKIRFNINICGYNIHCRIVTAKLLLLLKANFQEVILQKLKFNKVIEKISLKIRNSSLYPI